MRPSHAPTARFRLDQRRLLLAQPRIGPRVIERLESIGISSLEALARCGVERAVVDICEGQGSVAWANRRRALEDAVGRFLAQQEGSDETGRGAFLERKRLR